MLIPNGARIVVLRDTPEDEKNGIILPDSAKEIPHEGSIMFAGEESSFSVGQHVVFSRYSGTPFLLDGVEHLILDDSAVLVTVDKEKLLG